MLCCQQSPIMASFLALNDFEYFCPVLMYDKKAIEKKPIYFPHICFRQNSVISILVYYRSFLPY